jgi:NADH dehydrogenase (ubiquinone) Fe-S protein 2
MASALLRSLGRTSRTASASRLVSRQLSTSKVTQQHDNPTPAEGSKTGFDYHTVEDLQGMSAREILTGPKEDTKIRHFTGV